jgi:ankyrin repeat protein
MNQRRKFLAGCVAFGAIPATSAFAAQDKAPKLLDQKMVNLFVAKSHGDIETIRNLLKKAPALVNCARDWGSGDWETGLGAASHVGRREIATLLLDHGARLDAFAAAMMGMKGVITEMLKVRKDLHTVAGPHGISMLTHAISGREKAHEVFELLLESGADVNATDKMLMTPLSAAVHVSNAEQVEELLRRGADPAATNSKGESILDVARRRDNKKVIELIKNAIAK